VRPALLVTLAILLASCSSSADGSAPPSAPAPTSVTTLPAPSGPPAGPPSPTLSLPAGVPRSFADDVPAADVPAKALIPRGAGVEGTWYAATSAGDAIVVSWSVPGPDPFRLERGVVAWRHFDDGGAPWRPVFGQAYDPHRDPVLGIAATTQDLTGDGSEDALLLASTGGSGDCAIATVVDLATGTAIYRRSACDTTFAPSTQPVGLVVTQNVYAPGDAHCCPSSIRTTVLTFADGTWHTASSTTSPA